MDRGLKQDFTRRLSQCNKSEMLVLIYDIYFAYTHDAIKACERKDREVFKASLRKAQNAIETLIQGQNFSYEISKKLYKIYIYCQNELAKAMYENRVDRIKDVDDLMKTLYKSFLEISKDDNSEHVMHNTQQIYAGMTYGKTNINEDYVCDVNRGFLV